MSGRAPWDETQAKALIEARRREPGAMLPILHDLQERFGYIDNSAIPMIAEALNLSKAETLGVVSFYHDFRRDPVDGSILTLCRAEACQSMGCEGLVERLAQVHGLKVDAHEGGPLTIETVYCLGHCAASPAALLDGEPLGRLTPEDLDAIVAKSLVSQSKGRLQ